VILVMGLKLPLLPILMDCSTVPDVAPKGLPTV
jgi:hypothetical protein